VDLQALEMELRLEGRKNAANGSESYHSKTGTCGLAGKALLAGRGKTESGWR
jgi:hypothetical protein